MLETIFGWKILIVRLVKTIFRFKFMSHNISSRHYTFFRVEIAEPREDTSIRKEIVPPENEISKNGCRRSAHRGAGGMWKMTSVKLIWLRIWITDSTWTWRCLRTRRFAPCSLGISPLKEPAIETGHHQRVPIIIAAVLVIVNVVLSILFIFTEKSISPEFYYVEWMTIIILL